MSLKANNFQRLLFLTSKTPHSSLARGLRSTDRVHSFNFCALAFERHGYWAKKTIGFTKKLAFARATALGLDPAAEICRWYGIISCCLQRANAKVLRGEPVPGRHSAPPPGRFLSLGRDLALVGA